MPTVITKSTDTQRNMIHITTNSYIHPSSQPINPPPKHSQLLLHPLNIPNLHPLTPHRRPQPPKHQPRNKQHARPTHQIRRLPPGPPIERTKRQRPRRAANLAPRPEGPQLLAPLGLARLEARQGIQARDDGGGRDREQGGGGVELREGGEAREQEEGGEAGEDAELDAQEGREAAGHAALQEGGDQAHEAEEAAVAGGGEGEEVVGHEGEGEFHAGEEEDEGEVGEVEDEVGVGALGGCGCVGGFWAGFWVAVGFRGAVCGGACEGGEGFGEVHVEVDCFDDDEE
jgi:hypothetical protein